MLFVRPTRGHDGRYGVNIVMLFVRPTRGHGGRYRVNIVMLFVRPPEDMVGVMGLSHSPAVTEAADGRERSSLGILVHNTGSLLLKSLSIY